MALFAARKSTLFVGPQGPQGDKGPVGAAGPPGPTGATGAAGGLIQSPFTEVSSTQSTSSTILAPLLSQSLTTGANNIVATFSCAFALTTTSGSSVTASVKFALQLDGITQRSGSYDVVISSAGPGLAFASFVLKRTVLSGSHTVGILWSVDSSTTTATVDPSVRHASLLVQEVQ